jgi:sugar-specific transcriptional regulator TrmB
MIDDLKQLGLTEYEAKAYVALLQFGELDGKEAAKRGLVPYSAVHFVLQSLVQKNFAVLVSKKPMRFKAIQPEQAIDALIKEKTSGLLELKKKSVSELSSLKKKQLLEEPEKLDISVGEGQRFAHSTELSKETLKEKLGLTELDTMPIEVLKENLALAKRGVKCRFIATHHGEDNKKLIEKLKAAGFRIKSYPALHGFSFIIFDRKTLLLVITDPKNRNAGYSLKLNSAELSEALADYFEFVWQKAKQV